MVAQSIRNVTLYHGISQQAINALIVAHHLWKLTKNQSTKKNAVTKNVNIRFDYAV